MGAKPRTRQRTELAVRPAARPQPPVDVYSKVKRYAFSQIRKMKRSGYTLKRGTWSNGNLKQACAVGAIAFNGDQPATGASFDECFVVASPKLQELGVRRAVIHNVLLQISCGFEFSLVEAARSFAVGDSSQQYLTLGQEIYQRFAEKDVNE